MGVNPEWPQRIVQVKCDQFGKWEAIGEGCGGHRGILERLGILAFVGAYHDEIIYSYIVQIGYIEKVSIYCAQKRSNGNANQAREWSSRKGDS